MLFHRDEHPKRVQKLLGHSTYNTTMDAYTDARLDNLQSVADAMDDILPTRLPEGLGESAAKSWRCEPSCTTLPEGWRLDGRIALVTVALVDLDARFARILHAAGAMVVVSAARK